MKNGSLKRIGLASALVFALASRAPSLDFKFYSGISMGYQINPSSASLPESARLVPIHPSDTYARESNNGPIENILKGISVGGAQARFGLEARHGPFGAQAGIGGGVGFYTFSKDGFDFAERNYTNHPGTSQRGYGAALTYYTMDKDTAIGFFASPFINLSYHLPKNKEGGSTHLFLEYAPEFHSFDTSITTGYDRWNTFTDIGEVNIPTKFTNNTFKFGAGFEWNYPLGMVPEVYLALSVPKTTESNGIDIKGLGLGVGFRTKIDLEKFSKK
jgi:hypothetical protein